MGSPEFAVPSLSAALKTGYDIGLVVCQPDKPAGRGLAIHSCDIALFAKSQGLPIFQPQKLNAHESINKILGVRPDIIVVAAYGKLLPKKLLDSAPLGCINLHASLLPKFRGAAPINWAIIRGETKTGVATMLMNEKMDAGDILLTREIEIDKEENAVELSKRLAQIGADLLIETIKKAECKTLNPIKQDETWVTYAPLLKKQDGLIDWTKTADDIRNLIRGAQPWPIAFTHSNSKIMRIFKAKLSDEKITDAPPGTVVKSKTELAVATGSGIIYLLDVQLEGKNKMAAAEFLRGHPLPLGTVLGR